jgi:hypothetical protein
MSPGRPGGATFVDAGIYSSILPSSLQPGESAVEALVFDTPTPTGILTLRTNDQHQSVIASCTLRTP